jgi:phosphotransferase system enzyme I (PtsP)
MGIGFRALSLTPSALGAVKAMLLDLDVGKAAALIRPLIENPPRDGTIRERLEAFANAEGLQL